jgi:MHS family proline/betaine transporter-like MFS transporter
LLVVFGVVSLWASGFYICFIWMRVYMATISPNTIEHSHSIAAGVLVWLCVVFPLLGHVSDVVHSRERVMLVGGGTMAGLSVILFTQAKNGNVGGLTICLLIYAVALAAWGAPMCAFMVEAFPIEARYSAVAIGYNSAHAVIGGTMLLLCTYLATEVNVVCDPLLPSFT